MTDKGKVRFSEFGSPKSPRDEPEPATGLTSPGRRQWSHDTSLVIKGSVSPTLGAVRPALKIPQAPSATASTSAADRTPSPLSLEVPPGPPSGQSSPAASDEDEDEDPATLSCELDEKNLRILKQSLLASQAGERPPAPLPPVQGAAPVASVVVEPPPESPAVTASKLVAEPGPGSPTRLQKMVTKLDPEKQRYLLRVLESLEREESFGAQTGESVPRMNIDLRSRTTSARARTITFRALSTHGSTQLAGLNKIEIFDDKGQRVRIGAGSVACDRTPVGESLVSLFIGNPLAAEDKDMFVCKLGQPQPQPQPPQQQLSARHAERLFQISITLPKGTCVTHIKIWSYNSKTRDLGIGVKDVAVVAGGKILWQGSLLRGCANNAFDYSTTVSIPPSIGGNGQQTTDSTKLQGPLPPLQKLKQRLPAQQGQAPEVTPPITLGLPSPRRKISSHGRSSSEVSLHPPSVVPVIVQAPARERQSSIGEKTRSGEQPAWLQSSSKLQREMSLDFESEPGSENPRRSGRLAESARRFSEGRSRHVPKQKDGYVPTAILESVSMTAQHRPKADQGAAPAASSGATGAPTPAASVLPAQEGSPRQPGLTITSASHVNLTPATSPVESPCSSPSPGSGPGSARHSPTRFVYPTMPSGRVMMITMTTTWGDPYYIGLSGLDIFDERGRVVRMDGIAKLRADPPDVNVLEGYEKDPRTIDKLLDGINRTCDDYHVWLAPFTEGRLHTIRIEFIAKTTISLLRFWNYNKSRIHSYRGARDIEVELDGVTIFRGEIKKAPGNLFNADSCAEYILFSSEDAVVSAIEANDPIPPLRSEDVQEPVPRPSTQGGDEYLEDLSSLVGDGSRPQTKACRRTTAPEKGADKRSSPPHSFSKPPPKLPAPKARKVTFNFTDTWGDPYYMGLTGIKFFDEDLKPIPLEISQLTATPRDINELPNCTGDDRTLDKLIDSMQVTTDDHHMWMVPFTPGQPHILTVTFPEPKAIRCVRIWNYNKSREDSYRGAKIAHISLDDAPLSPPGGITIRKAPGEACFDFGQTVDLVSLGRWSDQKVCQEIATLRGQRPRDELLKQGYEISLLPCGFVFKFVFLSTWGDPFYLGLNGLEMYDWRGEKLPTTAENTEAIPRSINVLPDVKGDPRTLDKLFDGVNDTTDDHHMWLCPFTPGMANALFVWFDEPVALGMVKIWNYSKTPSRGVEEFELFVDDSLAFKGFLRQAPQQMTHRGPLDIAQTIMFTNDESMLAQEKRHIVGTADEEQHVQFINNRQVMIPSSSRKPSAPHSARRPKTSVQGAE